MNMLIPFNDEQLKKLLEMDLLKRDFIKEEINALLLKDVSTDEVEIKSYAFSHFYFLKVKDNKTNEKIVLEREYNKEVKTDVKMIYALSINDKKESEWKEKDISFKSKNLSSLFNEIKGLVKFQEKEIEEMGLSKVLSVKIW